MVVFPAFTTTITGGGAFAGSCFLDGLRFLDGFRFLGSLRSADALGAKSSSAGGFFWWSLRDFFGFGGLLRCLAGVSTRAVWMIRIASSRSWSGVIPFKLTAERFFSEHMVGFEPSPNNLKDCVV